jgi:hypothetical protein
MGFVAQAENESRKGVMSRMESRLGYGQCRSGVEAEVRGRLSVAWGSSWSYKMSRTQWQWTEGGLQCCREVKRPLSNPDPRGEVQGLYMPGEARHIQLPCRWIQSVVSDAMRLGTESGLAGR